MAPPLTSGPLPLGMPVVGERAGIPPTDHLAACWHPVGAPGTALDRSADDDVQESIR